MRRQLQPVENPRPARGIEPIRPVGGEMHDTGVLDHRLDHVRAVDHAIGRYVGNHSALANRGHQLGEVGEHGGFATAEGDLENTPGRQLFDDPSSDCAWGSGSRSGPLSE